MTNRNAPIAAGRGAICMADIVALTKAIPPEGYSPVLSPALVPVFDVTPFLGQPMVDEHTAAVTGAGNVEVVRVPANELWCIMSLVGYLQTGTFDMSAFRLSLNGAQWRRVEYWSTSVTEFNLWGGGGYAWFVKPLTYLGVTVDSYTGSGAVAVHITGLKFPLDSGEA